jgi:hypothetical protein
MYSTIKVIYIISLKGISLPLTMELFQPCDPQIFTSHGPLFSFNFAL